MAERRSGVAPCSNEHCKHPTRNSRMLAKDHPGTRLRVKDGKCRNCYLTEFPPPPKKRVESIPLAGPDPSTVAGLDTFMAGRRRREEAARRRRTA